MSAIRIHPLRREPLCRWRLAHLALFRTRRHNRTMSPLPRDRPSGLARPKGFSQTQNDRRSMLEKARHQPSQEMLCLQATHCSPRKPNTPFCMDRRISAPPQHCRHRKRPTPLRYRLVAPHDGILPRSHSIQSKKPPADSILPNQAAEGFAAILHRHTAPHVLSRKSRFFLSIDPIFRGLFDSRCLFAIRLPCRAFRRKGRLA